MVIEESRSGGGQISEKFDFQEFALSELEPRLEMTAMSLVPDYCCACVGRPQCSVD